MRRLGFVGTGTITAAMVRGLKSSELRDWPIVVSPRNPETAAELARELPGVSVAESNQDVVDRSEVVILAVRPQIAEAVIRGLRFDPGQQVISLVAAHEIETIRAWTGVDDVSRAVPLPFVAERRGVTPILPPNDRTAEIFNALGECIQVSAIEAFDAYIAASALMSTYFGILESAHAWLVANGLPAHESDVYVRGLFGDLGDVLRAETSMSLPELRSAHATRGGLNELADETFTRSGGGAAIDAGLTAVLTRLRNARAHAG